MLCKIESHASEYLRRITKKRGREFFVQICTWHKFDYIRINNYTMYRLQLVFPWCPTTCDHLCRGEK